MVLQVVGFFVFRGFSVQVDDKSVSIGHLTFQKFKLCCLVAMPQKKKEKGCCFYSWILKV